MFYQYSQQYYINNLLYRCERFQNINRCYDILLEEYYAESAVFIGRSDFEDVRVIFNLFTQDSPVCQSFFDTVLCFYEFQPCGFSEDRKSELLPICLERCPEIQAAFDYCSERIDISRIDPTLYPSLGPILENFNCTLPRSYYVNGDRMLAISDTYCSKFLRMCDWAFAKLGMSAQTIYVHHIAHHI